MCTSAIAVLFPILRKALSTLPFLSDELCLCHVSIFNFDKLFNNYLEVSVLIISGFCDGGRNLCRHDTVSGIPSVFFRIETCAVVW